MKVIPRYLEGNIFQVWTPNPIMPQKPTAPASTDEAGAAKSSVLSMDDYRKMFNESGLSNEIMSFANRLIAIEQSPAAFLDKDNRAKTIRLAAELEVMKNNKELFTAATAEASKNKALGEVAVGSSGEVFTRNEKGVIVALDPRKAAKNSTPVLTLAELLNDRQINPTLVHDQSVFKVANSSVGIETIKNHITSIISAINEYSNKTERHISSNQLKGELAQKLNKVPTEAEISALGVLAGVDQYKVEESLKTKRNALPTALKYIWSTLGEGGRNKLEATAALSGKSSGQEILLDILTNATQSETEYKITPETSKDGAGKDGAGAKGDVKLSRFEDFVSNFIPDKGVFFRNDKDAASNLAIPTTATSALFTAKDELISTASLGQIMQTGWGHVIDISNMYFGDNKIDPESTDVDKLIYAGGNTARAYVPFKEDGVTPDLDMLDRFTAVTKEIKANWTPEEINAYYAKNDLPMVSVGEDKAFIKSERLKPAIIAHVYTSDKFGFDLDEAEKLSNNKEDEVYNKLKDFLKTNKLPDLTGWTGTLGTDIYKGIVILPLKKDHASIAAELVGNNVYTNRSTVEDIRKNKEENAGRFLPQNTSSAR